MGAVQLKPPVATGGLKYHVIAPGASHAVRAATSTAPPSAKYKACFMSTPWSWPYDSEHMWEAVSPHPSCLKRSLALGSSQALNAFNKRLRCSGCAHGLNPIA